MTVLLAIALPALHPRGPRAVPALREPGDDFGGLRFTDYFAPSLLAITIAVLGLQNLPTGLATYREKGILRRLSTTPVRPGRGAGRSAGRQPVSAGWRYGAAARGRRLVLRRTGCPGIRSGSCSRSCCGASAMFALGLLVAALAPTRPAGPGIGTVAFF